MAPSSRIPSPIVVVGAGPAGLMAAETLAGSGRPVEVWDHKPSAARKFLRAGIGGLNLTHAEPPAAFVARYGTATAWLAPMLARLGPDAVRAWALGLGVETFVGTSQRVFPVGLKAAPLLRAWLRRLREAGVTLRMRRRWTGWTADGRLAFVDTDRQHGDRARGEPGERNPDAADGDLPDGVRVAATVLALGGGSWPQLGSDAGWVDLLAARGVAIAPLRPANCGFDVGWSPVFAARHAGAPVRTVTIAYDDADGVRRQRAGDFVVTADGIEGGLVYACAAPLRDRLQADGAAVVVWVDLQPGWSQDRLATALAAPRGRRSASNHLRVRAGLDPVRIGLLREVLGASLPDDASRLAAAIKALPLALRRPRPLREAISTAGGVAAAAVDANLELHAVPGVFCAGEMLDWEAPTGGYLLTGCLATGKAAALGVLARLQAQDAAFRIASDPLADRSMRHCAATRDDASGPTRSR